MDTLTWICIAQCAFVIILMLIRREKIADYIICGWLALLGLIANQYFIQQRIGELSWPGSITLYIAISAISYLYSKYVVDNYEKFERKDWLHFLPSVLLTFFLIITNKIPELSCPNLTLYVERYNVVFWIFRQYYVVATIIYMYLAIRNIMRFRKQIYDAYSYNKQQLQLNWLIAIYILNIAYIIINGVLGSSVYINASINTKVYSLLLTTAMIYLLSFGGILQKQLVMADNTSNTKLDEGIAIEDNNTKTNDIKTNIEENKKEDLSFKPLANQLISYIESSRAWRDSELSIAKLSTATGIQKHLITQTLNEYLGKNFYTLINGYRIEEAKRMMHDEKYKNYTFMSIAYDCGFNSKTAFYTAFKKITGTTPTEYQKKA